MNKKQEVDALFKKLKATSVEKCAEPEIVSNTIINMYGYRLRKIVSLHHSPRKSKYISRFFCLPELQGKDLPERIRENAHRTGYKTYNSFLASAAYYLNCQKEDAEDIKQWETKLL